VAQLAAPIVGLGRAASAEALAGRLPGLQLQRDFTVATLSVTCMGARGLLAADRGGKSDPYVLLTLGGRKERTKVAPRTLEPVWEETFTFRDHLRDLLARPLRLEVFDDDVLSRESRSRSLSWRRARSLLFKRLTTSRLAAGALARRLARRGQPQARRDPAPAGRAEGGRAGAPSIA
jgi:hypothetical protein